jgi:hypothetical protein
MIPNSDNFNWSIGPVGQAINFLTEETKIAGTLHRSLLVLENHEVFLRIMRERFEIAGATTSILVVDQLLAEAPLLSIWARELQQEDFSTINKHSLISIWSALEVAVEDTIVLVLSKNPAALTMISTADDKAPKLESGPVSEEKARRIFKDLERKERNQLKVGQCYIKLLSLFGIHFSCGDHVLSKLEEFNSVRNCLLHRGGVIDEKAAQSVEALRPYLGRQLPITKDRYLEYYKAVSEFLGAMMDGIISSPHCRIDLSGYGDAK